MTARDEVVQLLEAVLPAGTHVMPYARDVATLDRDTVMVRVDDVAPAAVRRVRTYGFAILALVPQTNPGTADDALDGLLEDILDALESSQVPNNIVWTKATRVSFEERFPCYQVDLTVSNVTITQE